MLLPCFNRLSNVGAPPATILGKRRSAKHQASADSFSTGGAKGRSVRTQSGENSNHKSEWKPNGFNGRGDLFFQVKSAPSPHPCMQSCAHIGSRFLVFCFRVDPETLRPTLQVGGAGAFSTWKNKSLLPLKPFGFHSDL